MILNLLVLALSAAVWISAVWLLLLPRLAVWPDVALVALHAIPPACITVAWIFQRRRIQGRHADEAQAREEKAQAERAAAHEAGRKAYDEEIRHRRFACDCRMIVFSRVSLAAPLPLPDPGLPNVDIRPVELETATSPEGSLIERLAPALGQALSSMYSTCRASLAFPVYVVPPADVPGEEVLSCVRALQASCAAELAPEMGRVAAVAPILFLPSGESVPDRILSLFESAPELPGAILLAFDSPHARIASADGFIDEPDAAAIAHERLAGKAGEAVVALLVTNASLPSMLAAVASAPEANEADSMTPYWERGIHAGGGLEILSHASPELREELAALPVLGRVHRATVRQSSDRSGVLALTRLVQDALEQAQIDAGLIDPPFAFNDAPDDEAARMSSRGETCSAIVHNAGSVDMAGGSLAALGSALYYFNIDLSPVDEDAVLNMVTRVGDAGRAAGMAQLAFALVYAAQNAAPALCSEFMHDNGVAVSFVMPATAADT
ncbi:hypothetical protein [Noviherbaspirillum denitrificans]|uniref:Uncharacterized protein n=1 Tax=Noviherbaspirillum denitrificans TaxID=1968433 RepID=A0A254TEV2_9BURK|nr:hypothetical protein [Noviherbaspirillum denitrificans]OWW19073.1 hypothetical protein AYR66_05770 [Noviherbaspirillum denitrificans]